MEAVFAADVAPVYRRRDLRANGVLDLRGLLMPGVSGNCWSIAEAVGLDRPYRLHHLLERARWEEDAARDVVRAFLARRLGADGGVLIFDETGQAKNGDEDRGRGPAVFRHDGPGRERDRRGVVAGWSLRQPASQSALGVAGGRKVGVALSPCPAVRS